MTVTRYPMNRFKRLQSQAVKTPSNITPSRKTKSILFCVSRRVWRFGFGIQASCLNFGTSKIGFLQMLTAAPVCWSRPRRGLQGQGRWWKLPSQAAAMRSQSCQHVQFQGRSALQRKVQLLGLPDLLALSASHFEQLLERRQMPCWQDQKMPSTQPSPKAQRSDESWWMPNCKATNPSFKLLRLEPKLC